MVAYVNLCSSESLDDLDPALVVVPEIVTLLVSLFFVGVNWKLARECILLLGLGREGSSIDSSNFGKFSVYFGMVLVFGMTRLPAVVASIVRIYVADNSSNAHHVLLGIECIFSPLQGLVLFTWFAVKLKYFDLWMTKRWFRDFVHSRLVARFLRCCSCCGCLSAISSPNSQRSTREIIIDDRCSIEEKDVGDDDSYVTLPGKSRKRQESFDDVERQRKKAEHDATAGSTKQGTSPSVRRRASSHGSEMPVIETFTGMF
eukprot:g1618.t1